MPAKENDAHFQVILPALTHILTDFFQTLILENKKNVELGRFLKKRLRKNKHFNNEQRALLALYTFGIVCFYIRIKVILNLKDDNFNSLKRVELLACIYLIDQKRKSLKEALSLVGLSEEDIPEVLLSMIKLAKLSEKKELYKHDIFDDLFTNEADKLAMPKNIWKIFEQSIDNPESCINALHQSAPIVFRAQNQKISAKDLLDKLEKEYPDFKAKKSKLATHGLVLEGRHNIYGCSLWQQGLYEVQDEGSQLITEALDPQKSEHILDFCAGYGGKTLAIWDLMENEGTLVAHDIRIAALEQLRLRSRRAVLGEKIQVFGHYQTLKGQCVETSRGGFDRILVDAPCSSLGTLRRGPDLKLLITDEELKQFPAIQLQILEQAAALLKVGGVLVYATCTINKAENEDVIDAFLDKNAGFFVPEQDEKQILNKKGTRLLRPDVDFCDAFFICRLRKNA